MVGPSVGESFARRLAEAARQWAAVETVADTAREAAEFAVASIGGCDAVRISVLRRDGSGATITASDEMVRRVGDLQYRLDEGPSLAAAASQSLVHAGDLHHDDRWPDWAARVVSVAGFSAVISLPLSTVEQELGVVDLFAKRPDAFDEQALEAAQVFAFHLSSYLAMTDAVQNLSAALSTRTIIGQAEGILMERFQLDSVRAFAILRRVSQDTNTRLAEVAEEFVRTRRTPGAED